MDTPMRSAVTGPIQSVNLVSDIVCHTDMNDRSDWVPLADGVAFKPMYFDISQGGWAILLAVKPGHRFDRHYHTGSVHGFTVSGRWRYLEHDWVAVAGTYIFEPPGEAHTLVVDDGPDAVEMVTFFVSRGSLIHTDAEGRQIGYEDVYTRLNQARAHYKKIGRDPKELDPLIR